MEVFLYLIIVVVGAGVGYGLNFYFYRKMIEMESYRVKVQKIGKEKHKKIFLLQSIAGNMLCYILILSVKGVTVGAILLCVLSVFLIALSMVDLSIFIIPIECSVAVFVIGVIATILDFTCYSSHLIGMVGVSAFLFILYKVTDQKGIGDGDIKVMIGAGLFLGGYQSLLALWVASVLGLVIHGICMRVKKVGHQLAFGPYLSAGILFAGLWGNSLWNWYVSKMS